MLSCGSVVSSFAGLFPNVAQNCDAFLRHKTLIIAPKILKQYSIPVHKVGKYPLFGKHNL